MAKKIKLTVELIPKTCHYSNVRTTIKPKEWDKVRFLSYAAADNKCEICKDTGKNQGYPHDLECHEIWHYDDETHTQKLLGLISLCPKCHATKHYGRAKAMGNEAICVNQLKLVNKWEDIDVANHLIEVYELYKERSKHIWKLDIMILKEEPYCLDLKPIIKRKFKKVVWKKKRKKKTKVNKRPKR